MDSNLPPPLPRPPAGEAPRRASGCAPKLAILLGVLLFASLATNAGLFAGRKGAGGCISGARGEDEFPQFNEKWSYGQGDVKVARIALTGVISRDPTGGFFSTMDSTESVLRQVRAATQDAKVRAILLEVDSPGGVVTPSDEIYASLKKFRASRGDRRVVVFVRDLAASGAYYASMAADRIVAEPTAMVGSIGVIIQTLNWSVLTEKLGIEDTTIKSGANKDLLNPFRKVDPAHVEILQAVVDSAFNRFKGIVREGRHLDAAKLDPIADGRIFPAERALEQGLIDRIGYWDDAVAELEKTLGVSAVRIVRYQKSGGLLELLTEARAPATLRSLLPERGPRMMYLWQP